MILHSAPGRPLVCRIAFAAAAALWLASPPAARAQFTFIGPKQSFAPYQFFPQNVEIKTEFPGNTNRMDHIVGFSDVNNDHTLFLIPTSPKLDFIANPLFPDTVFGTIFRNTLVFNASTLNIEAGGILRQNNFDSTFSGTLRTYDTSTVNLTAMGEITDYYLFDHSRLNMAGGRIDSMSVKENATATIDGGKIRGLAVGTTKDERLFGDLIDVGSPSVTITKGEILSLSASLGGSATMTGGSLSAAFATGTGAIQLSNVNVPSVQGRDISSISMTGGQLGGASIVDLATLSLDGVSVTGSVLVNGDEGCLAIISGGSVGGSLNVLNKGRASLDSMSVTGPVGVRDQAKLKLNDTAHLASTLVAQDNAEVEIVDGTVAAPVQVLANSSFVMKSGTMFTGVSSFGNGKVSIEGGKIIGSLTASGTGTNEIAVSGGDITDGIKISGSRTFAMTGGTTGKLEVFGSGGGRPSATITGLDTKLREVEVGEAELRMFIGQVSGSVTVSQDAHFGLDGGSLGTLSTLGTALSSSNGTIDMTNGIVFGNVQLAGAATMTMLDGNILGDVDVTDQALFIRSGGTIGGASPPAPTLRPSGLAAVIPFDDPPPAITVSDGGQLHIVGVDLAATLVDPNFEGMFSLYQLAGRLADGTNVGGETFLVQNGTGANFQLLAAVPEPSSLALTGLTTAVLATFRRRRLR